MHDNSVDDHVDASLAEYLHVEQPKSFFLFAGAGSGKTRSLVSALNHFRSINGNFMRLNGKQIAVITYTNAACDEIKRRLDHDPIVSVSTIHSFVWDLIQGFNSDIRQWLSEELNNEIGALQEQIRKGRPGTKAAADRERSLRSKSKRLEGLNSITKFIYSPTGDNRTRDSLNHAEVIKIGAHFLSTKPLMQMMLISKFPFLLIDESQDTNKLLIDAFFGVQTAHPRSFGLGLFGDTMQRIYSDGKPNLGVSLPSDWQKPAKVMNHRCPKRVIRLINQIRAAVDSQQQRPRTDAIDGHVRLYIARSSEADKFSIEQRIREKLAAATGDVLWNDPDQVKTLILEHHMAAKRMTFFEMFKPLYDVDDFNTGLRDGTLAPLRFFSELVLPLIKFKQKGNDFAVAAIIRKSSPLLSKEALQSLGIQQVERLKSINAAVEEVVGMCAEGLKPTFLDILQCVAKKNLFEVPDSLQPFIATSAGSAEEVEDEEESGTEKLSALRQFLESPFEQIERYAKYVKGEASFGTHQGVKGLEFPRVLVVLDDDDAGGFLFGYEKLFGAKDKSDTDLKNEQMGNETGIDRTRRLFYVTCSRSEKSLGIVAYSSNPERVKRHVLGQGWFDENEIEIV